MRFSFVISALAFALGSIAAVLNVPRVVLPVSSSTIGDISLAKKEAAPIPISTLFAPPKSMLHKRLTDGWDTFGYVWVKNVKDNITMQEPPKETWCWDADGTGKQNHAEKAFVAKNNICFFYEKGCDPKAGNATYLIGNDAEQDLDNKDIYVAWGCRKYP